MSHHEHEKKDRPAPKRMSAKHGFRLFILNAVLYVACGAFAGLVAMDYLPSPFEMRVLLAFFAVPLIMAVVSTLIHVMAARWTSVDDMAERFAK
ncbi:MAG: hypothetical protein U0574_08345 [Phycisphaerales bacterium]